MSKCMQQNRKNRYFTEADPPPQGRLHPNNHNTMGLNGLFKSQMTISDHLHWQRVIFYNDSKSFNLGYLFTIWANFGPPVRGGGVTGVQKNYFCDFPCFWAQMHSLSWYSESFGKKRDLTPPLLS